MEAKGNIKEGDTIVFHYVENTGMVCEYDGQVQFVKEDYVAVIYLNGYRSRNGDIPWKDIQAKVDMDMPRIGLRYSSYRGHFQVFDSYEPHENGWERKD